MILTDAEAKLGAALDLLRSYPAPLVAWKTYAVLGRLRRQMGDPESAREAFAQAATIVDEIGASVRDDALRDTFLNSAAVQEVRDETAASSPRAEM